MMNPEQHSNAIETQWREDEKKWRRHYLGSWCNGPAEFEGHLLVCEVGAPGHDGPCAASLAMVRAHIAEGQRGCVRNGCGRRAEPERTA